MFDRGASDQMLSTGAAPGQRRAVAVTAIVLIAVAAGFYSYQRFTETAATAALTAPRPPTPVEAAVAVIEDVPQLTSGIGSLQAIHQVMISPEVGGRVVKIFFEPGAKVQSGDPLVQLYDAPLKADLANYEAQRQLAVLNLQRGKELQSREFQSRQASEQQQAALDQAAALAAKTKAQIDQMLIRAPFAGELGVRQVEVGAYLNPGATVVTLTDLSTLWVNFTLPEQAATEVHVGQAVRVRADAFPDRVFDAKITAIEPQISAQTRTLLVQATLPNPDRALLPGMYAKAEAVLPQKISEVVVPETAIDYSLYGEAAYVIEAASDSKALKVRRVVVTTGQRFDGKVVVLSGLKGGERLVATGQLRLNDGAMVTIAPGKALTTLPSTDRY